jgi:hypothetical protein
MIQPVASDETEQQLIEMAQQALSQSAWEVGRCAASWTKRFARGRTDQDFGLAIGMSGDQVYQRRRVWEAFGDVRGEYPQLKWSHFYAALNWNDAAECLQWAHEFQASVAEMRAWRRAQHGDDLEAEESELEHAEFASTDVAPVSVPAGRIPAGAAGREGAGTGSERSESEALALSGVARAADRPADEPYAPFAKGARPVPGGDGADGRGRAEISFAGQLRRLTSTLKRCEQLLTDEFLDELRTAPDKLRQPLLDALAGVQDRLAEWS